ncbi:acyl-CoA dehydrogenase family protein [Alkalilimnicola sp. S0819]|uniref:acyl-CoA dehydrogenase family protein n=1 Tax=Alkalilimnicola sp. S0819 TaxID=2613922 RepID=UPI0012629789|nr:acyl-CoA dehydrogenase family protein [Alkalilimnicola sp. S0819]KAB7619543.1 DNA alkylation response protein [Alkalilimnicola sp. S0819]MPQ17650.1 DNA alkylation response protein [Alkalilimnicola sp. S0819]
MDSRAPLEQLATHTVSNQAPDLPDYHAYLDDTPLWEGVAREGGADHEPRLRALGEAAGSAAVMALGEQANSNPPRLRAFDRQGRRLDLVEYHPAYHQLMRLGCEHGVHNHAWQAERGGHVAHVALLYMLYQAEGGVCCPLTMTHAVRPALRASTELAAFWEPLLDVEAYDPAYCPASDKQAVTFGMAMTEKQGGSDVRANTTRAEPVSDGYLLQGHKWFCSAPMSDAFLTLAQAPEGLSCFLVPRWRPDGTRNPFLIQRLKDKLGNQANASAEIEYAATWAMPLGPLGEGVKTIIGMVQQTRLDAAVAPVALMRQALVRALHHCRHRGAFGKALIDQPLMRNVLADMALEVEAGLRLVLRLARAFEPGADEQDRHLARVGTAIAKYWLNKRSPEFTCEAMECLGGGGYVEESLMPRLYREAPVNGIWEGSGNVLCLDVLRAFAREPESLQALLSIIEARRGEHAALDRTLARIKGLLTRPEELEMRARSLAEWLAQALQASLLLEDGPAEVAEAWCDARLSERGRVYGALRDSAQVEALLARA